MVWGKGGEPEVIWSVPWVVLLGFTSHFTLATLTIPFSPRHGMGRSPPVGTVTRMGEGNERSGGRVGM